MALHPVAALDLPVASRERVSSGLSCSKPRWLSSKRHRVSESPGARAWPGQLTCYWEGNPVSQTSVSTVEPTPSSSLSVSSTGTSTCTSASAVTGSSPGAAIV